MTDKHMTPIGVSVTSSEFAILAGVTPAAISKASRKLPLSAARVGRGRIKVDTRSAWEYLASHPFTKTADDLVGCPDGFMNAAQDRQHRDEHGEPMINMHHPRAIAFFARVGCSFDEWVKDFCS